MFASSRSKFLVLLAGFAALSCAKPASQPWSAAAVQALTTPIDETTQPFFSAPWPDDRRLASDGTVPTDNFPNPRGTGTLAATMMQTGDHLVHGWGTSAPIYMPFTGAIDESTLPSDPKAANGSVFLVDIDPTSANRGKRAYVDFHFYADKTLFLPGNVLAVRPVPGFPLQEKTKYAVVVTTALKDKTGSPVGPEHAFYDVLTGQPQGSAEQGAATFYQPLLDELDREGISRTSVAGATIFTTQPIMDEMLKLRDFLLSYQQTPGQTEPTLDAGSLTFDSSQSTADYQVYEASYLAPNMQHGSPPFTETGGDFQYDESGAPVPGYTEHMRLSIVVPTAPMPPNGFPIVMYSHGTGGNYLSSVQEYQALGPTMAQKGLAIFGIDQVLTGPRSGLSDSAQPTGCFGMPVEDCFIDPVNAVAGRNNLRQAALDSVFLRRVAVNVTIPASVNPNGVELKFDKSRFAFIGHSQGGLSGALYTAIDPDLSGSVLSGAGGLVTSTILERNNPQLLPLIEGPLFLNISPDEHLDPYHPALALIQSIGEAVDPINFSRHWIKDPQGRAKSIYTTSGLLDTDTPADTAENLNAAAGIPELQPIARDSLPLDLAGLMPITAPVSGNMMVSGGTSVTAAFRQFKNYGHFPIFENDSCRNQWSTFLQTLLANGVPTIPAN